MYPDSICFLHLDTKDVETFVPRICSICKGRIEGTLKSVRLEAMRKTGPGEQISGSGPHSCARARSAAPAGAFLSLAALFPTASAVGYVVTSLRDCRQHGIGPLPHNRVLITWNKVFHRKELMEFS